MIRSAQLYNNNVKENSFQCGCAKIIQITFCCFKHFFLQKKIYFCFLICWRFSHKKFLERKKLLIPFNTSHKLLWLFETCFSTDQKRQKIESFLEGSTRTKAPNLKNLVPNFIFLNVKVETKAERLFSIQWGSEYRTFS